MRKLLLALGGAEALVAIVALASCGGNGGKTSGGFNAGATGTVSTTVSDPATCLAPSGPFQHVFVTVADVKASSNANAGDNDNSFVDLTPGLTPVQVDLLGAPST